MSADTEPMPVDLAREEPFSIGALAVSPPTREVAGGGIAEILEPRVMQVLVALARRQGVVVSRDELVRDCWAGRIIGDDAVHRCIAKVRKLGEASGAFVLETIPRVGYRLSPTAVAEVAAPATVAPPLGPVLAVLPFDNLSGDADLAFFSDGVSEEILHALSRNTNLKVIGRASSFQFRGPNKVVRTIAGELKTSHLLDGTVRRSGDRVRVSAHLIEAATQTMVWSDRFDRDLADIFALQDEIAGAVAKALDIRFPPPRATPAVSSDAYDLYLRGAVWSRDVSIDSQIRALMLLDEAVTRAPDLARAWGELALTRAQLRYLGAPNASAITVANITEPAERALALDPRVQAAWAALFLATPPSAFLEAEALFTRCRRAGFDVPLAHAIHLLDVGRTREALVSLERAQGIDPYRQMQVFYAALGALADGDLANARRLIKEATERWPQAALFSACAAVWAAHAGDWAEVDRLRAPARLALHPLDPWTQSVAVKVAALKDGPPKDGPPKDLHATLMNAEGPTGSSRVEAIAFAAHLGDVDAVFGDAGAVNMDALRRPEVGMAALFLPLYAGVRADPRFATLCAQLGLAGYWIQTGAWPDCADDLPYDLRAACRAALA